MRIKAENSLQRLKEMKAKKRKYQTFNEEKMVDWTQIKIEAKYYGKNYIKMVDWTLKNTAAFHSRADESFWFEDERDAFKFKLMWGSESE